MELVALGTHLVILGSSSRTDASVDCPEIALYSVHPGGIWTPGSTAFLESMGIQDAVAMPDKVELLMATYLWLTARNTEF